MSDQCDAAHQRLVMAERHVAEGRQIIEWQRALVAELSHDSHLRLLALARDLLATMLTIQGIAERHLAAERAAAAETRRDRSTLYRQG